MSQHSPPHVCSFESRRAAEMSALIEKQGGVATVAPSMQEVPLDENETALRFAEELLAGRIDVVVFMTGVGAKALLDAVETRFDRQEFLRALGSCVTVVRGPKPTAVLREWQVEIDHRAPEPNTWRELLQVLEPVELDGKTVAVQEYGQPNEEFYDALRQRGANVVPVPVYRWTFPDDTGPLRDALRRTIAGEFHALAFTSANQVTNLLQAAEQQGVRNDWLAAARRCVIASIGPTCSEALRDAGLEVHLEASPPKMGVLVREVVQRTPELLSEVQPGNDS